MVYTYKNIIPENLYLSLSSLEKQQALLQAAAVNLSDLSENMYDNMQDLASYFSDNIISSNNLVFSQKQLDYDIKDISDGIFIESDGIIVSKADASFTVDFTSDPDSECYFRFSNLTYQGKADIPELSLSNGALNKKISIPSRMNLFYTGPRNILVNMGYSADGMQSCTLSFSDTGKYLFNDMNIFSQPMNNYEEMVQSLKQDSVTYQYDDNHIFIHIVLDESKLIYTSIPYSKHWTAYVNGMPARIMEVNHFGMGIYLPSGEYDITLDYNLYH